MWHIRRDGVQAECTATVGSCPLGQHFETEGEAQQAAYNMLSNEFSLLGNSPKEELINELNILKQSNASTKELDAIRTEVSKANEREQGRNKVDTIDNLIQGVAVPDGGATFNLSGTTPVSGFCASPYPQFSKVFNSAKDFNVSDLYDFYENINSSSEGLLDEDEVYVGLWNDPDTGKLYLDVSKRYDTAEEARIACEQNDQIAFFDLNTFSSVDVDRNAKSGQN